jgi:hypothetical protein
MVQYELSHLTQNDDQVVCGPIQDDEALFLFSIIRGKRLKYVLEIGGLSGYSARNFCKAVEPMNGMVYTVDINPVPTVANNHKVILNDSRNLKPSDIDNNVLDMVFFDCHDFQSQWETFVSFVSNGLINDDTILTLHDTNTHPHQYMNFAYQIKEGWVHQPVERQLVNRFKEIGYDVFCLHTKPTSHNESMPFRHGVSVCSKFTRLET